MVVVGVAIVVVAIVVAIVVAAAAAAADGATADHPSFSSPRSLSLSSWFALDSWNSTVLPFPPCFPNCCYRDCSD